MALQLKLLLALSAVLLSRAAATIGDYTNQWCVKPNDTSHCTCDPDHCKTMAEYAQHPGRYFTSNTTVIFLSGDHSLNTTLLIGNVTNLAMVGNGDLIQRPNTDLPPEPSSRVNCTASVAGINFENITILLIQNISFVACGNIPSKCYVHTASSFASALSFTSIQDLLLSGVWIRDSRGTGFCGRNILGNSTIEGSTFAVSHYSRNMALLYAHCPCTEAAAHLRVRHSHFLYGNPVYDLAQASGLMVTMKCTNVSIVIENSTFSGNRARKGGNLAFLLHNDTNVFTNTITVMNCHIENGTSSEGGGMYVTILETLPTKGLSHCNDQPFLQVLNTTFINNLASVGGGMYIGHGENPGSSCMPREIVIGNCTFAKNKKGPLSSVPGGAAVHVVKFKIPGYLSRRVPQLNLDFHDCSFSGNVDDKDLGTSAAVHILDGSNVSISDSKFIDNKCTALLAVDTNILLGGHVIIQGNHGNSGGGIALFGSYLFFRFNVTVLLTDNIAKTSGGGILAVAEEYNFEKRPSCFFQMATNKTLNKKILQMVNITLRNNSATIAGDAVYGGAIDDCKLLSTQRYNMGTSSTYVFNTIFHPSVSSEDSSFISSDPISVCFCTNGTRDCDRKSLNVSVYPGQTLHVPAVVVGQRNGAVPGSVVAVGVNMTLADAEQVQYIPTTNCSSTLKYTILSTEVSANITLGIHGVERGYAVPLVNLRIMDCPLGFSLSQQRCLCDIIFVSKGMPCNTVNNPRPMIHRNPPYWVGACPQDNHKTRYLSKPPPHCPPELCLSESIDIQTWSDKIDHDAQCMFGRTGILCGACKPGLSLTLGSTRCQHCSNYYISVLSAFVVGGLLLVTVLTALNLTVTEGTINGLIFYANIVHMNADIFFPPLPESPSLKILASIPQVLIAWLNLDIGIKVCFYDGLDAYTKTWTEFAFPIYIWVIAGVIVLLSRRYTIVARATGRHAVQVLATLFLLSFAKLLNTIITSISFAFLYCEPKLTVWRSDGNIQYLQGKHIPLFVAAVLAMVCLSVPYTFILVSIQCLQRFNIRLVSRLKPVIDAYTGPYKDRYQFWTGYLLLVRIVISFTGAVFQSDQATNLLLILVVCLHLPFLSVWVFRGVYRKRSLDILESLFFLNLTALSFITLNYTQPHRDKIYHYREYIAYTLVYMMLILLVAIVAFHTYKQILDLKPVCRAFATQLPRRHQTVPVDQETLLHSEEGADSTDSEGNDQSMSQQLPARAAMTRFDQYREPVLGFEDSS